MLRWLADMTAADAPAKIPTPAVAIPTGFIVTAESPSPTTPPTAPPMPAIAPAEFIFTCDSETDADALNDTVFKS